ncbi:MAG: SDR family oxidoreductase [Verrucomicrobiales bacterium]|nr:SDR family oxidoreductase [Verrucomicrobiales bacterium]
MSEDKLTPFHQGQVFRDEFTADRELIEAFADFSQDFNPVHVDAEVARDYGYSKPFAHGAILSAVLSRIIGMKVPGPGAVWMKQNMEWLKPVYLGDQIEVEVTIARYSRGAGIFELEIITQNQKKEIVMEGSAKVKQGQKLSGKSENKTAGRRVALVTGGSRGIGASVAKTLGKAGIDVALIYHQSKDASSAVIKEIKTNEKAKAIAVQADLTDAEQTKSMLAEVSEQLGAPDIVIHAATPPLSFKNITELTREDFQDYLNVYLMAAHDLVQHTSPSMSKNHFGRYVFLGTSALFHPAKKMAAYTTAKYALLGYMRSLAFELGSSGITSNMISPSMAVTDLTEEVPARLKEMEAAKSSLRRLVTPEDIAETCSFLVSDAGAYLNGVNMPLTGGPV